MTVPRILLVAAIACIVSLPTLAQLSNSDLAKQVTVRRTEYGVPHILAQNERAAGSARWIYGRTRARKASNIQESSQSKSSKLRVYVLVSFREKE